MCASVYAGELSAEDSLVVVSIGVELKYAMPYCRTELSRAEITFAAVAPAPTAPLIV